MSTTTNHKFKITVPITRCYLRKSDDGVEKYVVEGMASNTNLDLTGERMAETAIASMAKSLESHQVIFKSEHHDDWDAEFGEVTALYATPEHRLMMEAELDPDHYRTKTLVNALNKGKALGLSIGGLVVDATTEWVSELSRKVKIYKDILLEEISVTGSPAVSDTWLTNITKSVNWRDMEKPTATEVVKTEQEHDTQIPETTDAAQAEEVTTAEEQQPATEASEPASSPASDADDTQEAEPEAEGQAPESTPEEVAPAGDTPAAEEEALAASDEEDGELAKSLLAATSQVEDLAKTLSDKDAEVERLTKSLSEKATEMETLSKSLDETKAKLTQVEEELATKSQELEQKTKEQARKVYVYSKTGDVQEVDLSTAKTVPPEEKKRTENQRVNAFWTGVLTPRQSD